MASFSDVHPDEEWYYLNDKNNEQEGPFPFEEFKNFYRLKKFTGLSYVWNPNFHESWIELSTDKELLSRLKAAPRLTVAAAVRRTRMGKISVGVNTPAGAPPHSQSFSLKRMNSSNGNKSSFDIRSSQERNLLKSIGESEDSEQKNKKKGTLILEEEDDTPLTTAEKDALDSGNWKVLKTLDGEVEYYYNEKSNQISYEKPDILLYNSSSLRPKKMGSIKVLFHSTLFLKSSLKSGLFFSIILFFSPISEFKSKSIESPRLINIL